MIPARGAAVTWTPRSRREQDVHRSAVRPWTVDRISDRKAGRHNEPSALVVSLTGPPVTRVWTWLPVSRLEMIT